jgi:hypothetical protein
MRALRPLTALALSLMLAFTGIGLAAARGQAMAGGQVVLCSGAAGAVTLTLDAQGRPAGPAHICPDMALGLIAALGLPDPGVIRTPSRADALVVASFVQRSALPRPAASARGPPSVI